MTEEAKLRKLKVLQQHILDVIMNCEIQGKTAAGKLAEAALAACEEEIAAIELLQNRRGRPH